MSGPVPPNGSAGKIPAHVRATIAQALATKPLPPYLVALDDPNDVDSSVLWTLQRASTPEGTEPGFMWPIYVDPDGRQIAGDRVAKAEPNPTVPL